jgi:alpha/beta superfamily hydrolase
MNSQTVKLAVAGPVGSLECALDTPAGEVRGVAVICHPHPVHGGTMDNKVVVTLARAFMQVGFRTVRFNFRGIGASQGAWDEGRGEVDDALAVIAAQRDAALPFMLAGFSFGAYVASEAATRLPDADKPKRMVLVGPSTQKQQMPPVPADTVVVHGEADEVVPLSATLDWARPQTLPVIVLPGVGHFFHGQITLLKNVVVQQLQRPKV